MTTGDRAKTMNYRVSATINRNKRWNLKKAYDCNYKFQLNDDDIPVQIKKMPQPYPGEGIMLVVTVQWYSDFGFSRQGPAHERIFFLPERSSTDSGSTEDALAEIISPLVANLGITSSDEHRSVTDRLVASAEILYNHHESSCPPKQRQINLDIVVETIVGEELEEFSKWVDWAIDESARFVMGMELKKKKEKENEEEEEEEEECCAICWEGFPVGCDFVKLPSCSHRYHEHCVLLWIHKTLNCPLCRAPLPDWDKVEWQYLPNFNLQIENSN